MINFLKRFTWYRRYKGGVWFYVYFDCHYLHGGYYEWTRDVALMEFPWHAKKCKEENYNQTKR